MGGFFFALSRGTHVPLPGERLPIQLFANAENHDLKLILCTALKSTKRAAVLSVYGITDPDILAHLKMKAMSGARVEISFDPRASSRLSSLLPSNIVLKPSQRRALMHRKMLCLDDSTVFLGSANFTPTSLRMHDNVLVGIYHPQLARFLRDPESRMGTFSLPEQQLRCYLLPEAGAEALCALVSAFDGARKSIRVTLFTFTHPALRDALLRAAERGVSVRVVLDGTSARGASRHVMQALVRAGIDVRTSMGHALLHHKWALVDDDEWLMGSANWTRAAFEKNEDVLLSLHPLTPQQKKFLYSLWKKIENDSADVIH